VLEFIKKFKEPCIYENGTKKDFGTFLSADQETEINYVVYTPKDPPHAIIQLVHGMNGTVAGYEEFALFMAENGVMVCGADLIGHGMNITSPENRWYFGSGDSDKYLVSDTASLTEIIRKKYRRLPYILYGHSLGSLIAREYVTNPEYAELIDGAVFSGTTSETPTKLQMLGCKAINKFCGEKSISKKLNNIFYNRLRGDTKSEGNNAWNCSNKDFIAITESFDPQPYFTTKGFIDIFNIALNVNSLEWAEKVPKNLPILLISGEDDSVGEYGEGVKRVYTNLDDAEICNLKMKLYPNMRHELLNEVNNTEVFRDVLEWTDSVVEGKIMSYAQMF